MCLDLPGAWNGLAIEKQSFDVGNDCVDGVGKGVVHRWPGRKAAGQVRYRHAVIAICVFVDHYRVVHRVLQSHPACRKMLFNVPIGKSAGVRNRYYAAVFAAFAYEMER